MINLRLIVLAATGQDVRHCCRCGLCSSSIDEAGGLEQWMQWLIANDERALQFIPAYSEPALQVAQRACTNRFDFQTALTALRVEAAQHRLLKQES